MGNICSYLWDMQNNNTTFKKGDKVTYTREFMFGKTATEVTTVVLVTGNKVLLQNGETFYC